MADLEYGFVSGRDLQGVRVRVRLPDRDGVESFWLQVPQRHTRHSMSRPLLPELGEQVAVLLDDDGVGGVVLGGVYSTANPPPVVDDDKEVVRFSDGTEVSYDRTSSALDVQCVGSVRMVAAKTIALQAGESITLTAPRIDLN
ncbi:phage baseplate assembly protein V [Stutzerimonas kirkiae]|uniref:phage baseplate assembly protein V n=1 Tax=Stutzerimonas kirkiae TaxID=2211392 RepID=UPI001038369F|nr:phage baseplate assembly protein V [Stutzerimonas kirkiae]TBV10267.1 phage baseplate assembly protein V [Stutzerimonas kirkiae]